MIEATKNSRSSDELTYPYLGEWINDTTEKYTIVLFVKPGAGTVVCSNGDSYDDVIGHWSNTWAEHMFTRFEGTVELRNK